MFNFLTRVLVLNSVLTVPSALGNAYGTSGELLATELVKPTKKIVVQANSDFAFDLYQQLAKEKEGENLFFSPFSVFAALAMTVEGARDETAVEMGSVLRFPDAAKRIGNDARRFPWETSLIHTGMADLNRILGGVNEDPARSAEIRVANALWGEQSYPFNPDYVATINKYYDTGGMFPVDFKTAFEDARLRINSWIEQQTNDRIKDLIPSGSLNSVTRLVLTNAIYFKGDWSVPFKEENTKERDFTLASGDTAQVQIMYAPKLDVGRYGAFNADGSHFNTPMRIRRNQDPKTLYPGADGFAMVELPYKGDVLSMVVIVPNDPAGLPAIEKRLTPENLSQWIGQLKKRKKHVYLPKFMLETEYRLGDAEGPGALQKMGMVRAFIDPLDLKNGAQFHGMTTTNDPMEQLYISKVFHKAFVEVNEQGTEAAAATAGSMHQARSRPKGYPFIPEFRADRPFVFLIREKSTGSVLFLGRMMSPSDTGDLMHIFKWHSDTAPTIALSPDGKSIASVGSLLFGNVELWDANNGKLITTFKGDAGIVQTVDFDGKRLAAAGRKGIIRIWDINNGELITTLQSHLKSVNFVDINFQGHKESVYSVAFSPDGNTLASSNYQTIKLWNIEDGKLITTLKGHTGFVLSVAFSPDGKILASGSEHQINLWNVDNGTLIATLKGNSYFNSVVFSPDGKTLAAFCHYCSVTLWNVENGTLITTIEKPWSASSLVAFGPDGAVLAFYNDEDKTIKIWSVKNGKLITTLNGHSDDVDLIAFSPDGKTITLGSIDNTSKLWSMETFNLSDSILHAYQSISNTYHSINKNDLMALHNFYDRFSDNDSPTVKHVINDIITLLKSRNTIKDYEWFLDEYHPNDNLRGEMINDIYNIVEKRNTLSDYMWFVKKYPFYTNRVIQNIFELIENEKNIVGYAWFIKKFSLNQISKSALQNIHSLSFKMAKNENTVEAYNDFIIANPYAKQVNNALKISYSLEEKQYSDWFSNEENNSRALRVKMIQLKMEMEDILDPAFQNGYLIVLNRMSQLLQNKFPAEEATLRYLESDKFDEFHRTYNSAMEDILLITNHTVGDSNYLDPTVLKQQSTAMKSYFSEVSKTVHSREMAEEYARQDKSWEQYMKNHGLSNLNKNRLDVSGNASPALQRLKSSLGN